jgi:DNA-binding MarR family transcriptional regulator
MAASPPLEDFLTYRLNMLATLLARDAARMAARHGLGLPEWRVLSHLAVQGPCGAAAIVARGAMDKAQVSRALQALAARGLAVLQPDPEDGRRQTARATASGRALHAQILPEALQRQAWLRESLAPTDAKALDRILEQLIATARHAGTKTRPGPGA